MELLPIHQSQTIVDIASTIRNTCNAALSLLFTSALFLYGLLVNRTQAWRTDGGTAVFGSAALALALISTALNFLYIPTKDRYLWLPSLIWAVVLWQSFLGWWWWVGASGVWDPAPRARDDDIAAVGVPVLHDAQRVGAGPGSISSRKAGAPTRRPRV